MTAGHLQLGLFSDMELVPTIAMERGSSFVAQCAWCGTLVCVPGRSDGTPAPRALGDCPSCRRDAGWWRQDLNEGPFRRSESAVAT